MCAVPRSSLSLDRPRVIGGAAAVVAAMAVVSGCAASGPATRAQVCESFTQTGTQLLQGNGFIGNPLFSKVKELGSTAQRLEGDPGVVSDGLKLADLGGQKSLTSDDLRNASMNIANLCGHPMGIG